MTTLKAYYIKLQSDKYYKFVESIVLNSEIFQCKNDMVEKGISGNSHNIYMLHQTRIYIYDNEAKLNITVDKKSFKANQKKKTY